jgi:hypothetical protein
MGEDPGAQDGVADFHPDLGSEDLPSVSFDGHRVVIHEAALWPAADGCWVARGSVCRHGLPMIPEA